MKQFPDPPAGAEHAASAGAQQAAVAGRASLPPVGDALERVARLTRAGERVESTFGAVLEELLAIFGCDRAWFLHPCDPEADSWHVPLERTTSRCPGPAAEGTRVTMDSEVSQLLSAALAEPGSLAQGSPGQPLPTMLAERFSVRAQRVMAIHPRVGSPWLLCIQNCKEPHNFGAAERELFEHLGRHIGDALSTLLSLQEVRAKSAALERANQRLREEVAERRRVEDRLELNQRRLLTLLANLPDGITVIRDGLFVYVNPRLLEMTGYTEGELLGNEVLDFLGEPDRPLARGRYRQLLEGRRTPPQHYSFRHKNGEPIPIEVYSSPLDYEGMPSQLSVVRDLREHFAVEETLRQSQKMEVVGRLAGGVAHDFNNVMQAILGHLSLIAGDLEPDTVMAQDVQLAMTAARHAASMTRRLLVLGKKHVTNARPLALATALREVVGLIRPLLPEDIELSVTTTAAEPYARFDPVHFEQVLLNAGLNARDALSAGGHLAIELSEVDAQEAEQKQLAAPPQWLKLQLTDDGRGMDEETLARALEPFFSTKRNGTGLGLSSAADIVEQHGGVLTLTSELGRGTCLTIYLPRVDPPGVSASPPAQPPADPQAVRGRGERVLLVEDEEYLLELMRRVLEDCGYRVTAASSMRAARAAFARDEQVALLLTDVVMPDGSGVDLARELADRDPDLRVILLSGYGEQVLSDRRHGGPEFRCLEKPITPDQLLAQVRAALDV
ncbi:MAG: PAS domain S-box protein [Myxococcales bacterium]|nr:PAS domain S-box protein [Myxococcales bacterium]